MGSSRPFGNTRKLRSGRHQARYCHLGKQVPADTTLATKAGARARLATMETDLLSGRHVDPSSGRERFGVFAERWLEARDLRPRTRDSYTSQLAHIIAEFETMELRKITPSAVRAWHGQLSKSGLHANTVAKVYRLLRTNPVHIKGAAVERSIERPSLDWDDIERIADAIHPRFRALVFTSVKDSPLVNRYFAPYWKKALEAAGLDESIRFHDLRHHAGTSAATAGSSLREIIARMGHASSDASLRYLKASARRDEEIADEIERRMNGGLDGR